MLNLASSLFSMAFAGSNRVQRRTARRGELRCSSAASGGRRGPERSGTGGARAASSSCPAAMAAAAAPQERRLPAPLPSPGSPPTPPGTGTDTGAACEGTASPVPGPCSRLGPARCGVPPRPAATRRPGRHGWFAHSPARGPLASGTAQ